MGTHQKSADDNHNWHDEITRFFDLRPSRLGFCVTASGRAHYWDEEGSETLCAARIESEVDVVEDREELLVAMKNAYNTIGICSLCPQSAEPTIAELRGEIADAVGAGSQPRSSGFSKETLYKIREELEPTE